MLERDICDLYELALKTCDVDELLERISTILGNPICVLDDKMRLVAFYPHCSIGDIAWDHLIEKGYASRDIVRRLLKGKNGLTTEPSVSEGECPKDYLSVPVKNLSNIMLVLFENTRIEDDENLSYFRAAGISIANVIRKSMAEIGSDSPSSLFARFISHGLESNSDELQSFLKSLGYHTEDKYLALYATYSPAGAPLVPYLEWLLSESSDKGLFTHVEDGIVGFMKTGDSYADTIHEVTDSLNFLNLKCGISDQHESLLELPQMIEEAQRVLSLGLKLNPDRAVYEFRDFSLQLFFSDRTVRDYIRRHRDYRVVALEEYDAKHGTGYCDDLLCCLSNFNNISRAAKTAFIHRNTLNYHIERIMTITGADLNDASVCLAMYTDLMAMKLKDLP